MSARPLVLAGPTATGKTEAALAVAERWGAVILSADAMQVYRGFDIGTAKASREERARAPHFGIDVADPEEAFDVGDFLALAGPLLADARPLVVAGGTSLYLRSLARGLVATPPVDPALRAELEAADDLHARLAAVDPALAARLHPHDRVRLVRGLEVWLTSGRRLSELQAAHAEAADAVPTVGLWFERDDLYARIDQRVEGMIEGGYVAEVEDLLAAGVPREAKPMRSLGYRHLCDHLLGELDTGAPIALDEAVRRTQRDTRHFARKQRNWRKQLGYPEVWGGHVEAALRAAERAFGPGSA